MKTSVLMDQKWISNPYTKRLIKKTRHTRMYKISEAAQNSKI